jgi:Uma2 family endonuclease
MSKPEPTKFGVTAVPLPETSHGISRAGFVIRESFEEFAGLNPDLRIEQDAAGKIEVMSPVGSESSYRNSLITCQLSNWTLKHGGRCFDSSGLFVLPNGAKRSPDAAWIALDRWNELTVEQRKGFAPIAPDFVIELRSETDRIPDLETKLVEFIQNGVRLGWIVDPILRRVHIYRKGNLSPEVLDLPDSVAGEQVLPGFVLELKPIWQDA